MIEAIPLWMAAGRMMATALLFLPIGDAFIASASNSAAILASSVGLTVDGFFDAAAGVLGRATGWTRAPPEIVEGSLPQISTIPDTLSLVEDGEPSSEEEK